MGYKVKLNVFEGPFDLLVYLIENAQMNIYDIQIAEITDQYLEYVDEIKKTEVAAAAEFMVLAAALIEIKSKMLLPRTVFEPDSDGLQEDPRTELVEKLMEYKRFKLLANMLQQRETEGLRIREKPREDLREYTGEPEESTELGLGQFVAAFRLFLQKKKKMEEIRQHHLRSEKQRITAELRMEKIRSFFREHPEHEAEFHELVEKRDDKYDVALTFSSVLEMVKSRSLTARQEYLYGDILLKAGEIRDAEDGEESPGQTAGQIDGQTAGGSTAAAASAGKLSPPDEAAGKAADAANTGEAASVKPENAMTAGGKTAFSGRADGIGEMPKAGAPQQKGQEREENND